jgi:hypothetical protein
LACRSPNIVLLLAFEKYSTSIKDREAGLEGRALCMGGGRTAVGWHTTHGAPPIGLTMGPGGGGARNLPSKKYPLDSSLLSPGTRRTGAKAQRCGGP